LIEKVSISNFVIAIKVRLNKLFLIMKLEMLRKKLYRISNVISLQALIIYIKLSKCYKINKNYLKINLAF